MDTVSGRRPRAVGQVVVVLVAAAAGHIVHPDGAAAAAPCRDDRRRQARVAERAARAEGVIVVEVVVTDCAPQISARRTRLETATAPRTLR